MLTPHRFYTIECSFSLRRKLLGKLKIFYHITSNMYHVTNSILNKQNKNYLSPLNTN